MPKKKPLSQAKIKKLHTQRHQRDEEDGLLAAALELRAGRVMSGLRDTLLDPYLVELERAIEGAPPATTDSSLWKLRNLHLRAIKTPGRIHPLDAWTAMRLAADLGRPAPQWASATLGAVEESKAKDVNGIDLNQALGFAAQGRGRTSEVERRVRENIADQSRLRIWGLTLLGRTIKQACWMEAGRMQQMAGWNTTDYPIEPDLKSVLKDPEARDRQLYDKRLAFAEKLRQDYHQWRSDIEKNPDSEPSRFFRAELLKNEQAFLQQFPADRST